MNHEVSDRQDVYAATTRLLRGLGHDVVTASELGMFNAKDVELLQYAQQQNRIMVTRDRDFGALVFVQYAGAGIIYLTHLAANSECSS